jgi:hypothetical protein
MKGAMSSEPIPLDGLRPLLAALTSSAEVGDIDNKSEFAKREEVLGGEYEL